MSKQKEKHITVTPETHAELEKIAKAQRRSMRAVVTNWINKEVPGAK
jgi:predicted HicB family RNase H-like nuclease